MASYRNIYQFSIVSQNGDDVDIFILKKNYAGVVQQRPLGRAPILKRERNGNVLGTSLEIFAECRVDGEFAQLYTSSADEFLVEVYRNQVLQWSGFVSPELYSEPDIAPPYDVQIIATDGLGELKNYDFVQGARPRSFLGHLNAMLTHASLDLGVDVVSELEYYDDGWAGNTSMMSIVTDMSHRESEDCYEVLQSMLASVNGVITQQAGRWVVLRESDLHALADSLSPVAFGSMANHEWWPIGNLSTDVIPAKKSLSLTSENHYKSTVLGNSHMDGDAVWETEFNALYDADEGAYRLPVSGSTIRQKVNFNAEVGYRLLLHISARNVGSIEEPQMLGVIVKIDGRMYQVGSEFWLYSRSGYEDKYLWANTEQHIEVELPASSESDTRSDAQGIDIVIPLYKYDNRSYAYATALEVSLYNVSGNAGIAVYECSLSQYDRSAGNKIAVTIGNGAREDAGDTELGFSDGEYASAAADVFRDAVPLGYDSSAIIKKWRTPATGEGTYLSVMAQDYAMQVALPRMRYRGKLNVPSMADPAIPIIFERDSTYYFLNTYSYDLLHDELEVELVSIPNASVTIESETVTELPSTGSASGPGSGSSGGGGTSGGGGGGSSTLAGLSDVQVGDAQNGQALVYENGYWVPRTVSGGGALTSDAIISALGYTPFDSDAFTKANIKNALGIKDWALASSKPSYTFAEITSKPTTLSGYGITDAVPTWDGVFHNSQMNAIDSYRQVGYGNITNGWKTNGPAIAFGISGYTLRIQAEMALTDNPAIYASLQHNSTAYGWVRLLTDANAYTKADAVGYNANIDLASDYKAIGYGHASKGWKTSGPAVVFGDTSYNLAMQCAIANADYVLLYVRNEYNGVEYGWDRIVTEGLLSRGAIAFDTQYYKCLGDIVIHRNSESGETYLNYGVANTDKANLRIFGYDIFFYAGEASAYNTYLSLYAGGTAQFFVPLTITANLTVTGDITASGNSSSKNFPQGKAFSQDPTSAFITTMFDADAVGDTSYRLKVLRNGTGNEISRMASAYAPLIAIKSSDTHAFISIGHNDYGRSHCYIGAGSADKISWSGILFHDFMSLIPKNDNTFSLGDATHRWSILHATSIKIGDATLTWDASAGMLKIDKGVYIEGAITAKKKA